MREANPNAWPSTTFGNIAIRLVNGGTPPTDVAAFWKGNIPWITGADFTSSGVGEFRRFVSKAAVASTATNVIEKGELLLVTRTGVGKLAIAPCDIAISQDITGVYADRKQVDPAFLYHRMRRGVEDLKKLNQGTSINGIIRGDLLKYPIDLPPLPQQERIAEILSTLDEAIEQTEALIAKTQAIKAGLMHDLFTRGVTANGELRPPREEAPQLYKDSPLGRIPKEWHCRQLGELAEVVSGVTLGQPISSTSMEVPYLRVANVQDGYFDLGEIKTVKVAATQLAKLILRAGDVLMNEGGDFDKLGRGAVWNGEISPCIHQNHVFRVRPKAPSIRSYYLAYWSQTAMGRRYFLVSSKQSTNLASINSKQLHRFPIAVAAEAEQISIETRLRALDEQLTELRNELVVQRSLKHGLMHDLLTGRVPVPLSEPGALAVEA